MSSIQWTDETWLVGKSWWSNGDVGVGGGPMLDWIVIGGESGAEPGVLRNSSNNPLYLLCFAAGNDKGAPIAVKIANHILKEAR